MTLVTTGPLSSPSDDLCDDGGLNEVSMKKLGRDLSVVDVSFAVCGGQWRVRIRVR